MVSWSEEGQSSMILGRVIFNKIYNLDDIVCEIDSFKQLRSVVQKNNNNEMCGWMKYWETKII